MVKLKIYGTTSHLASVFVVSILNFLLNAFAFFVHVGMLETLLLS